MPSEVIFTLTPQKWVEVLRIRDVNTRSGFFPIPDPRRKSVLQTRECDRGDCNLCEIELCEYDLWKYNFRKCELVSTNLKSASFVSTTFMSTIFVLADLVSSVLEPFAPLELASGFPPFMNRVIYWQSAFSYSIWTHNENNFMVLYMLGVK